MSQSVAYERVQKIFSSCLIREFLQAADECDIPIFSLMQHRDEKSFKSLHLTSIGNHRRERDKERCNCERKQN